MKFKESSRAAQERLLNSRLAIPALQAGRILQWGRKKTREAIASGALPVIDGPGQPVPTNWLRRKLQFQEEPPEAA
jgi:hypothetical protein